MLKEKNNYDYMDERLPDDGGRSLEDIISAVGEQELAEVPHVPMTPERLAALAAARDGTDEGISAPTQPVDTANKEKKRKHMYKLVGGIAAVFVLILIGAAIAFNALSVDVGADKNQKEEVVTEDGVIIEEGGYGASDNTEGNVWSINSWEEVEMAKRIYPQMMIPEYIPEGYEFEQLIVEPIETGDIISRYVYLNDDSEALEIETFILGAGELSLDINDVSRTIECSKNTLYIQEDEMKKATIQTDDGNTVTIWSNLSDEELIKIIDNLAN